jgi:hypothetical protein
VSKPSTSSTSSTTNVDEIIISANVVTTTTILIPKCINKIPQWFILKNNLNLDFQNFIIECSFKLVTFKKIEKMFLNHREQNECKLTTPSYHSLTPSSHMNVFIHWKLNYFGKTTQ